MTFTRPIRACISFEIGETKKAQPACIETECDFSYSNTNRLFTWGAVFSFRNLLLAIAMKWMIPANVDQSYLKPTLRIVLK